MARINKFMKYSLSIVVPAKDEEKSIIATLITLKDKVKIPHEIIVVNDFSADRTEKVVKNYSKKNKNVIVVKTKKEEVGFSNAIRKGIKKSSAEIVVIVMADLCDDPETINKMYKKIEEGWDIVCGSRYIKGGKKIGGPKLQRFFSAFVCKSLHYIISLPTMDGSNAFKMFRKSLYQKLEYKKDSGVESSLEFILRAYFRGFKIIDVPTVWKGREVGISKFKLLERSPKYIRIYLWALKQRLKNVKENI